MRKDNRKFCASISVRNGERRLKLELSPASLHGGPEGFYRVRLARRWLDTEDGAPRFFDRDGIARLAAELALCGLETPAPAPDIPCNSRVSVRRADGFYAYAEELNRLAEPFRGTGILLQYHNHSQEFRNFPELNGKSGLQILIENTDPELMAFELDVFWASAAGCDPVEWIEKLRGRIPVIHYKDHAIDCASEVVSLGEVPRMFAEIGQGNLNWKAITAAARDAGVEWYNIEQDQTKRPVFESLQISIDYMRDVLHIQ